MQIIKTIRTAQPEQTAYAFGACLAADRGVSNVVERIAGAWVVIADDGRAVEFRE